MAEYLANWGLTWPHSGRLLPPVERLVPYALAYGHAAYVPMHEALRFAAKHTGVPAIVICAAMLVVGYRVAQRTFRFAVQVSVVLVVLVLMTTLGWISF